MGSSLHRQGPTTATVMSAGLKNRDDALVWRGPNKNGILFLYTLSYSFSFDLP